MICAHNTTQHHTQWASIVTLHNAAYCTSSALDIDLDLYHLSTAKTTRLFIPCSCSLCLVYCKECQWITTLQASEWALWIVNISNRLLWTTTQYTTIMLGSVTQRAKLCTAVVAGVHLHQPTHSLWGETTQHNVHCKYIQWFYCFI